MKNRVGLSVVKLFWRVVLLVFTFLAGIFTILLNAATVVATAAFVSTNGVFVEKANYAIGELVKLLPHGLDLSGLYQITWLPSLLILSGWLFLAWTFCSSIWLRKGPVTFVISVVKRFILDLKAGKYKANETKTRRIDETVPSGKMNGWIGNLGVFRRASSAFKRTDDYPHAKFNKDGRITLDEILASKLEAQKSRKTPSHITVLHGE